MTKKYTSSPESDMLMEKGADQIMPKKMISVVWLEKYCEKNSFILEDGRACEPPLYDPIRIVPVKVLLSAVEKQAKEVKK